MADRRHVCMLVYVAIHIQNIQTDRVKIVALRKCSRKVSGAAVVKKKNGVYLVIVQRRRLGND